MPDKNIEKLLMKYLNGHATPEEKRMVDDWYDSLSEKESFPKVLTDTERRLWRNRYWNSLMASIGKPGPSDQKNWWPMIGIAASVTALITVAILVFRAEVREPVINAGNVAASIREITNKTEDVQDVILPDSSVVKLSPGSKLTLADEFNIGDREISLSGEAFFDIRHNKEKPFFVFTNEVVTRVLGTSFTISAYPENENITVSVKSGKVSVYTKTENDDDLAEDEKVILSPNQQAIYKRSDNKVSTMLVKDPAVVITEEEIKKIRFEGAPVSQVFKALEKMYGVEIIFKKEVFNSCSITTSVNGDDLYEKIDVICEITGSTYEVKGTQIEISGTGCK